MLNIIKSPLYTNIEEVAEAYQTLQLSAEIEYIIKNKIVGLFNENEFDVNGDPYAVQCFMGVSNIIGYDLKKANQMLKLKKRVAIGLVDGDDPICIEKETGHVYLLLLETGDGEEIKIAESVEAFINKIKF